MTFWPHYPLLLLEKEVEWNAEPVRAFRDKENLLSLPETGPPFLNFRACNVAATPTALSRLPFNLLAPEFYI
jgi:hypothetical protein